MPFGKSAAGISCEHSSEPTSPRRSSGALRAAAGHGYVNTAPGSAGNGTTTMFDRS